MVNMIVQKPGNRGHGKGGRSVFSEAEEEAIASRVKGGETKQALAAELEVHRNTIGNICDRVALRQRSADIQPARA